MKSIYLLALIIFTFNFNLLGQEYARINSLETIYKINNSEDVEIIENLKVTINSKEAEYLGWFIDYTDKFRQIQKVTITIFDATGRKIKKVSKMDGTEYGFSSSFEIDDSKLFVLKPDYQNYPYTAEIESEVVLNGFISLQPWVPRSRFNVAVDKSTLKIIHPEELKINILNKTPNDDYSVTSDKGFITRFYEVSNLQAEVRKKRYKDFYEEQPKVLVTPEKFSLDDYEGSFASWESFGNWYYELNNSPYELSTETKVYLSSLDRSDKKDLIKNIYHYMQDKTRYISIQLGIGGFKSLPTSEVDAYGFGDCKALTTYMKNMLSYAGVNSNYVLVKAGSDVPDINKDFPSNQFNHVYLGVPSMTDTLFLECTSQNTPAFYTGKFTDDRNVLWIEKDRSKIIRSTVYDKLENVKSNTAEIELTSDGNAKMQLQIVNGGIFYDEIMAYNTAKQDYIKMINQEKFHYKDFSIDKFEFNKPTRDSISFVSKFDITINGLGKTVGDRLILPVNTLSRLDELIDINTAMNYASITRAFTIIDSVKIKLPKDRWIYNLPEAVAEESEFGSYSRELIHESNYLIIYRKITFNKGDFTKNEFQEFEDYFKKIEKVDNKKLVVNSKT